MNSVIRVRLTPTTEQHARLVALQVAFAEVCNALGPTVRETRVWNRVALHHMAYKALRERYPAIGSQMVCNAIYSVSRACRILFQSPNSPFNVARFPREKRLPLLRFTQTCPVYFDRHTLSLKQGQVSMFTLDGRMRFQIKLSAEAEEAFHQRKLLEIVLSRHQQAFDLSFVFAPGEPALDYAETEHSAHAMPLTEYLQLEEAA